MAGAYPLVRRVVRAATGSRTARPSPTPEVPVRDRTLNQLVATVVGAGFALTGLAGFLVTDSFVGQEGDSLLGFQVNGLHNVVHLLIGLALLVGARTLPTARTANLVIGLTYLALAVVGPFLTGTEANV